MLAVVRVASASGRSSSDGGGGSAPALYGSPLPQGDPADYQRAGECQKSSN